MVLSGIIKNADKFFMGLAPGVDVDEKSIKQIAELVLLAWVVGMSFHFATALDVNKSGSCKIFTISNPSKAIV